MFENLYCTQDTWSKIVKEGINKQKRENAQKLIVLKNFSLLYPFFSFFHKYNIEISHAFLMSLKGSSRRPGFDPWVGKFLWRREWQSTPIFLPGESHGQRSLAGYSPRGHKIWHDWVTNTLLGGLWLQNGSFFPQVLVPL